MPPYGGGGSSSSTALPRTISPKATVETKPDFTTELRQYIQTLGVETHDATVCIFCKVSFNDLKKSKPNRFESKVLSCLHSACRPCLEEQLRKSPTVMCPVCDARTEKQNYHGYLCNFMVHQGADRSLLDQQGSIECDECVEAGPAVFYCTQCVRSLCLECSDHHRRSKMTAHHSLIECQQQQEQHMHRAAFCYIHTDQKLEFFCETCDLVCCRLCILQDHEKHKYKLAAGAVVAKQRQEVSLQVEHLRATTQRLQDRHHMISQVARDFETDVEEAGRSIEKLRLQVNAAIEARRQAMLREVDHFVERHRQSCADQRATLTSSMVFIWRAVDFMEKVLAHGSAVEILFVKSFIARKNLLSTMVETGAGEIAQLLNCGISWRGNSMDMTRLVARLGTISARIDDSWLGGVKSGDTFGGAGEDHAAGGGSSASTSDRSGTVRRFPRRVRAGLACRSEGPLLASVEPRVLGECDTDADREDVPCGRAASGGPQKRPPLPSELLSARPAAGGGAAGGGSSRQWSQEPPLGAATALGRPAPARSSADVPAPASSPPSALASASGLLWPQPRACSSPPSVLASASGAAERSGLSLGLGRSGVPGLPSVSGGSSFSRPPGPQQVRREHSRGGRGQQQPLGRCIKVSIADALSRGAAPPRAPAGRELVKVSLADSLGAFGPSAVASPEASCDPVVSEAPEAKAGPDPSSFFSAERAKTISILDAIGFKEQQAEATRTKIDIFASLQARRFGGVHGKSDEELAASGLGERAVVLGAEGEDVGSFKSPCGIAVDEEHIFIADTMNHRIQVFDRGSKKVLGQLVVSLAASGGGISELKSPSGICVTGPSQLTVVQYDIDQVLTLRLSPTKLEAVEARGVGSAGEWYGPFGCGFSASVGRAVVANCCKHRCHVFSASGRMLRSFGKQGDGPGEFDSPSCVATFADGGIAVSDKGNHRVQVFGADGEFHNYVPSRWTPARLLMQETENPPPGILLRPMGAVTDQRDRLYVCDCGGNRVQIFTRSGNWIWSSDTASVGDGYMFRSPTGIAIDDDGHLYISSDHCVQVF